MIEIDKVISNVYHYELSNKIQFSNNNRKLTIENYRIELNGDGTEVDSFQIKIDGLNETEARSESDRIANIFINGIIAESFPPTFVQYDLSRIDHNYKSGKTTYRVYKSLILKYNIEAYPRINNNFQTLSNDTSKHELLEKIKIAIKSYTKKDFLLAYLHLYFLVENNNVMISASNKDKFRVIRHLFYHQNLTVAKTLKILDNIIQNNYPFEFEQYYYKQNDSKNIAMLKLDSEKNDYLAQKAFDELYTEIKSVI